MSRNALLAGTLFLAGLAVLVVFYLNTRAGLQPVDQATEDTSVTAEELLAETTPGPFLEIVVAGEANGVIRIDLLDEFAPGHVERITTLAAEGAYDDIVFHRVIDKFMAQTGDVQFGKMGNDMRMAGRGGSDRPDLKAEFSEVPFERGIVGMARSQNVDSANSQFFIMFEEKSFLNNKYTVVGHVTEGMDVVDAIKRGDPDSGAITGKPDRMVTVTVKE